MNACRFDQCSVSPLSLKGIKDAGYEKMTVVQEATLPVILKGLFSTVPLRVLPTINSIMHSSNDHKHGALHFYCIIICESVDFIVLHFHMRVLTLVDFVF